jgi:hypothetical protein
MDAVDFSIKAWANRFTNEKQDIELYEEILISTFFQSVRKNIKEGSLSRDQEVLLVLECMNATMNGTDDEHADTLSRYLGIKV